jgi:hypothetical protein
MAYHISNECSRKYVFGIVWGELYGNPGPLRTLCRDEDLSSEDVNILSTAPVKILPLVKSAPTPDLLGHGPYIVSKKALNIILSLQLQGILSIPLNLSREERGTPVADYFLLQVLNFIDCIDFDRTKFLRGSGFDAAKDSGFRRPYGKRIVLKRSSILNNHLWRAEATNTHGRNEPIYFISDELHERFEREEIRGWGLQSCDWSLND